MPSVSAGSARGPARSTRSDASSAAGHRPSLLTRDVVEDSDVVVTMGCGETCPISPGKRYEDWRVQDPKDRDLDAVRAIVDDIDSRVRVLLVDLGVRVQG